jgi:hypothetical protein
MRVKLYKQLLLITCLSSSFLSCEKDLETLGKSALMNEKLQKKDVRLSNEKKHEIKSEFAKILAKAIKENVELRQFIKEEAKKEFDNDADILYHLVKNNSVTADKTFRDILLESTGNKDLFYKVEEHLPLLNIFIPSLPDGFSMLSWDPQTEIPYVSTATAVNNKIEYILGDGTSIYGKFEEIPNFPVLVVKENERVVVNNGDQSLRSSHAGRTFSTDQLTFRFIDEDFDGSKPKSESELNYRSQIANPDKNILSIAASEPFGFNLTPIQWLQGGYNVAVMGRPSANYVVALSNQNKGITPWQRDFIYYGLTNEKPTGQLNTNLQETLVWMKFIDGAAAYRKIADQQGDPTMPASLTYYETPAWSEGNFEFKVTVLCNSTVGFGSTIEKFFTVAPQDLFDVTYKTSGSPFYQEIDRIEAKEYRPDLPLVNWNLGQLSYGMKLSFEEVDLSETVTKQTSQTSQFAGNFSPGGLIKQGLGFGGTATFTNSQTYTVVTNLASDQLGDVTMLFSDPVTISGSFWPTDKFAIYNAGYTTGLLTVSVVPYLSN